jgi:hypothetical protein
VDDLRVEYAEGGSLREALEKLKVVYGIGKESPIDEEEAREAAAQYEELSIWLEHGCGGSEIGALWSLGTTALQMTLAFAISMYSVIGQEFVWAKQTSLTIMCAVQSLSALWSVLADPIDRLEGLVACFVSTLEASATGLLLFCSYMSGGGMDEDTLSMLGTISTNLLMASVFAPIVLSLYDNMALPALEAMHKRMETGESCGRALCGILLQLLLLPFSLAAALFGVSFRAGDVLQAAIDESRETVADGKARGTSRARGTHRDRRAVPTDANAIHNWGDGDEEAEATTAMATRASAVKFDPELYLGSNRVAAQDLPPPLPPVGKWAGDDAAADGAPALATPPTHTRAETKAHGAVEVPAWSWASPPLAWWQGTSSSWGGSMGGVHGGAPWQGTPSSWACTNTDRSNDGSQGGQGAATPSALSPTSPPSLPPSAPGTQRIVTCSLRQASALASIATKDTPNGHLSRRSSGASDRQIQAKRTALESRRKSLPHSSTGAKRDASMHRDTTSTSDIELTA